MSQAPETRRFFALLKVVQTLSRAEQELAALDREADSHEQKAYEHLLISFLYMTQPFLEEYQKMAPSSATRDDHERQANPAPTAP